MILRDISERSSIYESIFDNPVFMFLREMNLRYGAIFTLYCILSVDNYKIKHVVDKYKSDFINNASWLKFGFHSFDGRIYKYTLPWIAKKHYEVFVSEVLRFAGSMSIDCVIRLHGFSGNQYVINKLIKSRYGIKGLLCADDNRKSYYLDKKINKSLFNGDYYYDKKKDIIFIKTDIRYEQFYADTIKIKMEIDSLINRNNRYICLFTHEKYIMDSDFRGFVEESIQYLSKKNCQFSFL